MEDGQIFSKNLRDSLFNDDLSNEPNFGRIHLAGQCLYLVLAQLVEISILQTLERSSVEIM
jgi:hypothetical protein